MFDMLSLALKTPRLCSDVTDTFEFEPLEHASTHETIVTNLVASYLTNRVIQHVAYHTCHKRCTSLTLPQQVVVMLARFSTPLPVPPDISNFLPAQLI
jgi:hypothetical protein